MPMSVNLTVLEYNECVNPHSALYTTAEYMNKTEVETIFCG